MRPWRSHLPNRRRPRPSVDGSSGSSRTGCPNLEAQVSYFGQHPPPLDMRTKREHSSPYVLIQREGTPMIRAVIEEVTVLASLALFMGMIAVWAHVIAVL